MRSVGRRSVVPFGQRWRTPDGGHSAQAETGDLRRSQRRQRRTQLHHRRLPAGSTNQVVRQRSSGKIIFNIHFINFKSSNFSQVTFHLMTERNLSDVLISCAQSDVRVNLTHL